MQFSVSQITNDTISVDGQVRTYLAAALCGTSSQSRQQIPGGLTNLTTAVSAFAVAITPVCPRHASYANRSERDLQANSTTPFADSAASEIYNVLTGFVNIQQ